MKQSNLNEMMAVLDALLNARRCLANTLLTDASPKSISIQSRLAGYYIELSIKAVDAALQPEVVPASAPEQKPGDAVVKTES